MFNSLKTRRLESELMDQPELAAERHVAALKGLSRINLWSASATALWRELRELARSQGAAGLRVLDVATGGGDVPLALWGKARAEGVALRIDGCDVSPRAVAYAQERASAAGADLSFFVLNALEDPLPPDYDVVMSTLFLHHLTDAQAVELLGRMAAAAQRAVVVDDLQRLAAGWAIAFVGTRFLSRSRVVHIDGLRSVAAAYTMDEAAKLAESAGLTGARLTPHWPFRYLLSWRRE